MPQTRVLAAPSRQAHGSTILLRITDAAARENDSVSASGSGKPSI